MLSILETMTMMTMQIFSDAMFDEIMFSTYFDKCALYQLELVIWSDRQSDVTCQTKICENSPLPLLFSLLAWNLLLLFTSTLYSLSLYDRASYSAKSGRQQRLLHAMHWPENRNWFLPRHEQKPQPRKKKSKEGAQRKKSKNRKRNSDGDIRWGDLLGKTVPCDQWPPSIVAEQSDNVPI